MPYVFNLPTTSAIDNNDYLLMEESTGGTKKITKGNVLGGTLRNIAIGTSVYSELYVPPNGGSITITMRASGNYHSGIIVGTVGGSGGKIIGFVINDDQLTIKDLMTGNTWSDLIGLSISLVSGTQLKFTNNFQYGTYLQVFAG